MTRALETQPVWTQLIFIHIPKKPLHTQDIMCGMWPPIGALSISNATLWCFLGCMLTHSIKYSSDRYFISVLIFRTDSNVRYFKISYTADILSINLTPNRYDALSPAIVYINNDVTIPFNSMTSL